MEAICPPSTYQKFPHPKQMMWNTYSYAGIVARLTTFGTDCARSATHDWTPMKNKVWVYYVDGDKVYRTSGTDISFSVSSMKNVKVLFVTTDRKTRDMFVEQALSQGKTLAYGEEVSWIFTKQAFEKSSTTTS